MKRSRNPPQINDLLAGIGPDRFTKMFFGGQIDVAPGGHYYHWDQLRHRPSPDGLSSEEWWLGIKMARQQGRRTLPLIDAGGHPFSYVLTDEALSGRRKALLSKAITIGCLRIRDVAFSAIDSRP